MSEINEITNIFYKDQFNNEKITTIIKNQEEINNILSYILKNHNSISLIKYLTNIFEENKSLIFIFQNQSKLSENSFLESFIELYIKNKEENEILDNFIQLCLNYIPINKNMIEIIYQNLSKYFRNEAIYILDEEYFIKHLKVLNLLLINSNNKKEEIENYIYFNGINSKITLEINKDDSNGFKVDYPFLKYGFFITFSVKINKNNLEQFLTINEGIEINFINFLFDSKSFKLSLINNNNLKIKVFEKINKNIELNNFQFDKWNNISLNLNYNNSLNIYINGKEIFKSLIKLENTQCSNLIFFENFIGQVTSIFFISHSINKELLSYLILLKSGFYSNEIFLNIISKFVPSIRQNPFFFQFFNNKFTIKKS